MKTFDGSVVIVTGAAGGLGSALAEGALSRGAKVVLSDVRADALEETRARLSGLGEVIAVQADVSSSEQVEHLAEQTMAHFGKANLLFNNAGVFASGLAWDVSEEEYDWIIGVNQKSVINGIRAFVPKMIAQNDPCHVVTISSGAGLIVSPGFSTYSMTKHAVLALSEALYLDLKTQGVENVGVTVVMPGTFPTGIMQPEKASPAELETELKARLDNPVLGALEQSMREQVDAGKALNLFADEVYAAIEADQLHVLPSFSDPDSQGFCRAVAEGRISAQNPYLATVLAPQDD